MDLATLCQAFCTKSVDDEDTKEQLLTEARGLMQFASPEDWELLSKELEDCDRKWFVAAVFSRSPLPTQLLMPMIRAAIYETSPSLNKQFVLPCISSHGYRIVNETLLEVVRTGSDFEKAGAINALYWAEARLAWPPDTRIFTLDTATEDSRMAYVEHADFWKEFWEIKRCLYLTEFVSNEDVDVRRSIIPSLSLDVSRYSIELKPLVSKAILIARQHQDDYIRHRIEVQLGNDHLLYPLPDRKAVE